MKSKNEIKYRIIHDGCCYVAQKRFLWFFWERINYRALLSVEDAETIIKQDMEPNKSKIIKYL